MRITPEQLHEWYLEATDALVATPESFNPNARKAYSELSDAQKYIDQYVADRINEFVNQSANK